MEKNESRIEKWLSILALIAGVIALVLSWQANRIANEANEIAYRQIEPNAVILNTVHEGTVIIASVPENEGEFDFWCQHKIRIANFGGAPESITDYIVSVFYGGSTTEARGYGEASASGELPKGIGGFETILFKEKSDSSYPTSNEWLSLPLLIDSFSATDIQAAIRISTTLAIRDTNIEPIEEDFSLIEAAYTLKTASNKTLASPRVNCWWVK
jgi:hypothetical protein